MHFSVSGLGMAVTNAKNFAFSFPQWGRAWVAALMLLGAAFVMLKVYARYALPKPMRPKVRLVRNSVRVVVLSALLGILGTALVFVVSALTTVTDKVAEIRSWLPW